jgi:hypothetical protein
MNYYTSGNKSQDCTIMVYPANGYMGYMMCEEMVHESKHGKMQVKEVLAVCFGTGGMYEKLKEMGSPVKMMVLEDASRMSEWKKEMKGRECDAMMLCTEGAPHHRNQAEMGRDDDVAGHLKKLIESMENAIEMTRHMNCKTVTISTAFAADESKYTTWNHIYKAMEKACKKHLKGNCATLFHNMMFEALYLSRDEIIRRNSVSWPVKKDAMFCPMAAVDFVRCCICVMQKMMNNKSMDSKHKKFHVTGRDKLSSVELMDLMSDVLDMDMQYDHVDCKKWRRMIEKNGMLCPLEMRLDEEVFEMMKKGDLKKSTDECKKLTGRKPMKCEEWLEEHREMFENSD